MPTKGNQHMTSKPGATAPLETDTPAAPTHALMANAIRALAMDAVQQAKSGHPGMPMGMADVATVLFTRFMKFCPQDPAWPDRDRFVLSAGHGSMLHYAVLYLLGFEDMTIEQIKSFRQIGSRTPGHPEVDHTPGVEVTTGPLGQGLSTAVGMALAERMLQARFGDELVDHHTYVIASDGDLMEGISHEAISLAGHLKLSRLIVLFDDNGITIDGPLDLAESGNQIARFEAAGWEATRIDGHDPEAIAAAIAHAQTSNKPSLIACRTKIGFGAPTKEGTAGAHGAPLGADEITGAREALGWTSAPFDIPADILDGWRVAGLRAAKARAAWQKRLDAAPEEARAEFTRVQAGSLPNALHGEINAVKRRLAEAKTAAATRKVSQTVLDALTQTMPELVGGSADLTGSNNTRAGAQKVITAEDFSGSYIHYGIREHAMAAAMNGIALHKGLIPYGGTFLVFSDYCRPAIRLAALMRQRVIYVLTHDSIGLGEDGPTHQPVEHLAALRAIPHLNVFRPADAVETAEVWEAALKAADTPSVIALTRQTIAAQRVRHTDENLSARGGYELIAADGDAAATVIATGSEVEIAAAARKLLQADGIPTRVVSMPCHELFLQQPSAYRDSVLQPNTLRIAVEAGIEMGWPRFTGTVGHFVGMRGFGASAPYQDLYTHFEITAAAVAQAVRDRL